MSGGSFFQEHLEDLQARQLRRALKPANGPQGAWIDLDGRRILNFSSNDYLGLAADPRLADAARQALEQEGVGAGASRLISGHLSAHRRLEQTLAEFKKTEAALVFSTGYMANVGILSSILDRDDVVFSDRLNHASIVDGIILSRAQLKRYPHADMEALEDLLKVSDQRQKKLIVTDSVFSMDGDIAPLDRIVDLAERYGALVMVDEAHGLGVMGQSGRGVVEHFGVSDRIDIQMGTLSKAAGCLGGYVCGSRRLIDYLVNAARSFIYTTALPPMVAAASRRGIEIIRDEPQRRERLWHLTGRLRQGLLEMGLDVMRSQTPIVPVLLGDQERAVACAEDLLGQGIWCPAIRPPTVPAQTSRLRVTVTAAHTDEDIDRLLAALRDALGRLR